MTSGRTDLALVRRHIFALDTAVTALARHQGKPLEELRSDVDLTWAVERGLQLCAQNCLDIATHLAAGAGRDVPDYTAALDAMADLGVLERDFAARFRGVAGFRNVVVHAYLDVDLTLVHRLLNERLEDFATFARSVEAYLALATG